MRILLTVTMPDEDNFGNAITIDRGCHNLELEFLPRVGDVLYLDELINPELFPLNRLAEVLRIFHRKDENGFYYEIVSEL